MKYNYILIIVVTLLIVFTLMFALVFTKPLKIENIKYLYFSYSDGYAANSYATYTIECKDKCIASIKLVGHDNNDVSTVELTDETMKQIEDVLNINRVDKWNGFNKVDKNVLDGDSFTLNVRFDNDKEIHSHGYMKYPKNYSSVRGGLDKILKELVE